MQASSVLPLPSAPVAVVVTDVLFHVRVQADPDGYTTAEDLCAVTVRLPAHASDWFEIPINADTKLRYL